jgi:hypothetical protein
VVHARGSIETPLADKEIEEKGRILTSLGNSGCDFDNIADLVWRLDELPHIAALMTGCRPTCGTGSSADQVATL